jgi:hypothetical protein
MVEHLPRHPKVEGLSPATNERIWLVYRGRNTLAYCAFLIFTHKNFERYWSWDFSLTRRLYSKTFQHLSQNFISNGLFSPVRRTPFRETVFPPPLDDVRDHAIRQRTIHLFKKMKHPSAITAHYIKSLIV